MMWESPIEIIKTDIQTRYEEKVMEAVISCGINVNKEELIKALQYDRQQYEKGYEDAKAEQQWIPCSKRLPEENDYKSCIECLDGAVWYLTENGTMGLGYYYESTKEWSTTDDLKTDGKVVAWMPLPEPYQEGANE